ncbi:MAG: hypothetical protein JXQ71_14780 [Verrucomicrobia bacterium]|nr:hypothetical protein [Verrucomicrobiota bacterium]
MELGTFTEDASIGWWSLYTDPEGCNLYFAAQTNDAEAVYLQAPVELASNQWYQVVLTYTSSNSALYINDWLLTNGTGVTYWPSEMVRSNGFCVGSDETGVAQVWGQIDLMILCDYAWEEWEVLDWYDCISPVVSEWEGEGESMQGGGGEEPMGGIGWLLGEGEQMSMQGGCTNGPELAITRLANGSVQLDYCGLEEGVRYDLLSAETLGQRHDGADIYWETSHEIEADETNSVISTPLAQQRFYRIVRLLDPDDPGAPAMYVSANAAPGGDGSKDLPLQDLQTAIMLAPDGSVVQVLPGVYSGVSNRDLSFGGKRLTLVSEQGWEQTVIDCTNAAGSGGFEFTTTNATAQEIVIIGFTVSNAANSAVYCSGGSRPAFVNCAFARNQSSGGGGAVYCDNASPWFQNCLFLTNRAATQGGVVYATGANAHPKFSHCTLNDNARTNGGGQVYAVNGAEVMLNNCIVWGVRTDLGDEVVAVSGGIAQAYYCDIRAWTNGGTGNFASDPAFEANGTARLTLNSPCLDQGTTNALPGFRLFARYDADGEARLDHAVADLVSPVDIGADEFVYRLQFPTNEGVKWVIGTNGLYVAQTNYFSEVDEASGVAYLGNSAVGAVIAVVDDEDRTNMHIYQLNADASAITQSIPVSTLNTNYDDDGDQEITDMEGLTYDSTNHDLYLVTSQTKRNRYRNVDSSPPILDPVVDPPSNDYDRRRAALQRIRLDDSLTTATNWEFFESEYVSVPYNTDYLPTNGLAAYVATQLSSNSALDALNWGNKVLIAWNTVNKFGTPNNKEDYPTNQPLPYLNGGTSATAGTSLGIFDTGGSIGTNVHSGLTAGATYYYKIWAVDAQTNYYEGPTAVVTNNGIPVVYINEFDAAGDNETVELYNPSPVAVSIAGCYLSDRSALEQDHFYQIPAGVNISARGVWAVNDPTVDFGFHFDNDGDENMYLFWTDGTTVIDGWNMRDPAGDYTEGRVWDGGPRGFTNLDPTNHFDSCEYKERDPVSPYPTNLWSLNLTQPYKRFDAVADLDQTKVHLVWQDIGLIPPVWMYSPKQHDFHALNVEDIAYRTDTEIILGLRAPLVSRTSSNAYYFTVTSLAAFLPDGGWTNGQAAGISGAYEMDLGGLGIRSIKWCSAGLTNAQGTQVARYLVLAGNANGGPLVREKLRQQFSLYAWDGTSTGGVAHPQLLIADLIGYAVRPEGVELINVDGQWRILFVEDRFQSTGYATRNALHWPVSIMGTVE